MNLEFFDQDSNGELLLSCYKMNFTNYQQLEIRGSEPLAFKVKHPTHLKAWVAGKIRVEDGNNGLSSNVLLSVMNSATDFANMSVCKEYRECRCILNKLYAN